MLLKEGQTFTLTTDEIEGDETKVSISYKELVHDIKPGGRVLIDDGLVELTVLSVTDTDIVCRVLNEGTVSDHKGVNVPGTELSMPFISEQDYSDICFGIEQGFDFIAHPSCVMQRMYWRSAGSSRRKAAIPSTSFPRSRICRA